ncbi:sugar transporter [Aliiroseovarius sp. S2029]|uniref:sugar transporter n=1 Tax=Aliiroseovarius sp. S2029 TaxID=2936988 RepID=UPI0020BF02C5|nr:sugar transporter [Aliiroseovarius sp. S2029]MCK8485226.1 sugar transporter [Aliiroseovarius sp. S2029]
MNKPEAAKIDTQAAQPGSADGDMQSSDTSPDRQAAATPAASTPDAPATPGDTPRSDAEHDNDQKANQGAVTPAPQAQAAKAAPKSETPKEPKVMVAPMAQPARIKPRHRAVMASFFVVVLLPLLFAAWYLYARALDQYVSYVAFTVRSEDVSSASDLLGGLSAFGSGGSEDTDILYEFIQSRELVSIIDDEIDLRSIYAASYETDPYFSFDPEGTIEDLAEYWSRVVKIFYDSGTGLIEVRVHAFHPQTAKDIAERIFDRSSAMINDLSADARADATRYASEELDFAVERLKEARQAITEFRSRNQIVDPAAEIGGQTGLMSALQTKLSDALITFDLLRESAGANDPRMAQAELRIQVIRERIEEERLKYGADSSDERNFSTLVGEYERLAVEREFAEQTYLAALAALDSAKIEAQRQSRYLAAYIKPTLAERAEYPQKALMLGVLGAFLLFTWAIGVMIFYAIKDRR